MNTAAQFFPPGTSLETSIDAATLWLCTAKTREERRAANNVLSTLVQMRSAERVEQMERERGLR